MDDRFGELAALLPDAAARAGAYARLTALLERHWEEIRSLRVSPAAS
jgi:hypothetical protein